MLEHPSTTVVPADAPGVPEASVHSAASSDFDRRHEALLGDILAARERRARARRKRIQDRRRAFGDLCEASEGLAVAWLRRGTSIREIVAYADGDVWLLRTLARWLRLGATRRIDRLRHAARGGTARGEEAHDDESVPDEGTAAGGVGESPRIERGPS